MSDIYQSVTGERDQTQSNGHVKFEEYLKQSMVKGWEDHYIAFRSLKSCIDEILKGLEEKESAGSIQSETTALLVGDKTVVVEGNFQKKVKDEMEKVNRFYLQQLEEISTFIKKLEQSVNRIQNKLGTSNTLRQHTLQRGARVLRKIGKTMQKLVQLEKFAILNYTGFLKIFNQHDKKTPFKIKSHFETLLNSQAFSSLKEIEARMRELETLKQSLNKSLEEKRAANMETPRKAGSKLEFKAPHEQKIPIEDNDKDDSDLSNDLSSDDEKDEKEVESDEKTVLLSAQEQKSLQRRIWWFLIGVFVNQIANNSLLLTMTLVLLDVTSNLPNKASVVAFITAICNVTDGTGTVLGGWFQHWINVKKLMVASVLLRAGILTLLSSLIMFAAFLQNTWPVWPGGFTINLYVATAIYLLDAGFRGITDTTRSTFPVVWFGRNKQLLNDINAKYTAAFEAGVLVGPLICGVLLTWFDLRIATLLPPISFIATAVLYSFTPKGPARFNKFVKGKVAGNPITAFLTIIRHASLALPFFGIMLLQVHRLKVLLPAFFATQVLNDRDQSAWLFSAYGVGGVVGSVAFNHLFKFVKNSERWLLVSFIGALLLSYGWLPSDNIWIATKSHFAWIPYGIATFLYAAMNDMARIAMNATLQGNIPPAAGSGSNIIGLSRLSVEVIGMINKIVVGAIFAIPHISPRLAYWFIGFYITFLAILQIVIFIGFLCTKPRSLKKRVPSKGHGLPGRLIVIEGLDGSGKSTQLYLLQGALEDEGMEVTMTRWNASPLMAETIKNAKKRKQLTPVTFTMMQAADLAEQINTIIRPALAEGRIVICDRFFYTSLARDSVRGMDKQWLRSIYNFALTPDLILYFKIPVEIAISRVLERRKELALSEDAQSDDEEGRLDDDETESKMPRLNYYEAGLDLSLSKDPIENFKLFQTRVAKEYDAMALEFNFHIIDSTKSIAALHEEVINIVSNDLGPLDQYKQAPQIYNIFDKDPLLDPPHIRNNYLHQTRGADYYFRNMLIKMRERFIQLCPNIDEMPIVFLHGNPHIANYVRTLEGVAMLDFDRSCMGPYGWDIVRVLCSISIRQRNSVLKLLKESVLNSFKKGYLKGLREPEAGWDQMRELQDRIPNQNELSTNAYLAANRTWAREMRSFPIPTTWPDMIALLHEYLKNRHEEHLLQTHQVTEAGLARSMISEMDRKRYLVVLSPIKQLKHHAKPPANNNNNNNNKNSSYNQETNDSIFLDIKKVRSDPNTKYFYNPYKTEVERMLAASELYSPGHTKREGYAIKDGEEYHIREIPIMNVKLKGLLSEEEQVDFAYAVGTQLGRGHVLSLKSEWKPQQLENDFLTRFDQLVEIGEKIKQELLAAHRRYVRKLKRGI